MRLRVLVVCAAAFWLGASQALAQEVNVYSARKEELIKPILDRFTERSGIAVRLLTGEADALIKRLQSEGANTPADVLLTTDVARLYRAQAAGLLQPVRSEVLEASIPAHLRDPAGSWFGLSLRARPIMYARGRVTPEELSTYEALADPRWKGRICVRSSDSVYNQSMVASMIAADGEEATSRWLEGLVANFARPPQGGDRDQIAAAAAGSCDLAIANTYYLAGMLHSGDSGQHEAASVVAVFWPNQSGSDAHGRGTHVNVSGAGVVRGAAHAADAVRLLEFLAGDEAQAWYAQANQEYPVKPGVPPSETIGGFGEFKADPVNLSRLGELNATALRLMDQAGWR